MSPRPRSTSTTVAASVIELAAGAVSRMRMTSPPMLLGRKLLKNGNQKRAKQRSARHADVLRHQQQIPAPHAGRHVQGVRAKAATSHSGEA